MRKTLIQPLLICAVFTILLVTQSASGAADLAYAMDSYVYLPYVAKSKLPVDTTDLPEHWLERYNVYREAAGLPSVVEDPAYSSDLAKHVNYMLLNPDDIWHGETPGRPGYTAEGAQAAAESNFWFPGPGATAADAIDVWMGSIPHRYGMLHHDLVHTGFAIACDSQHCGTGLNVLRGLELGFNPRPRGVVYPGEDQRGVRNDIIITWQFDWHPTVVLVDATLTDAYHQSVEVDIRVPQLDDYHNVIAITPSAPLAPGATYTMEVHVTLGDQTLSRIWSFTTRN